MGEDFYLWKFEKWDNPVVFRGGSHLDAKSASRPSLAIHAGEDAAAVALEV